MRLLNFFKCLFRHRPTKVFPENTKEIFYWEGGPVDTYHWWPMKECLHTSLENNLYSKGGGLSKYDYLFCGKAVEYQRTHHFRAMASNESDSNWAGFCDSATILSCTRKYPQNAVRINYNNKDVLFSVKDIESLMIIASYNSIINCKSCLFGNRNNGRQYCDPDEPRPIEFLKMIKKICSDKIPFALDISKGTAVWNYSYNKVIVKSSNNPPNEFKNKIRNLSDKNNTYYNFIITSDAYPLKNLNIWGWVSLDNQTSGWLSEEHPDFIWKQYPRETCWDGMCEINPEVSAKTVFEIYNASISGRKYLKIL